MKPITRFSVGLLLAILSVSSVGSQGDEPRSSITLANAPQVIQVQQYDHGYIQGIAWSPDGEWLAVNSTTGLLLYSADFTQNTSLLFREDESIEDFALSSDGSLLAVAEDLRDTQTGTPSGILKLCRVESEIKCEEIARGQPIRSIAFSPDGIYLADVSGDRAKSLLRMWAVTTRTQIASFEHDETLRRVFSTSRGILMVSDDGKGTLGIWSALTNSKLAELTGYSGQVMRMDVNAMGTLLATSDSEGNVRLMDIETATEHAPFNEYRNIPSVLVFSPSGDRLITGALDGTLRVWDAESGTQLNMISYGAAVRNIAVNPTNNVITFVGPETVIRFWDTATNTLLSSQRVRVNPVYAVSFSPDGSLLASAIADHKIQIWIVSTAVRFNVRLAELSGHQDRVNSVEFSPDGSLIVSGGSDNTIRLWDVATQSQLAILGGHTQSVNSVTFSRDGRWLASGSDDGTVRIWDVESQSQIAIFESRSQRVIDVTFSPDGKYVAAAEFEGTVRLWDVATGSDITALIHKGSALCVAFSPDGSLLASGGTDHVVRFWDVQARTERLSLLQGHGGPVSNVVFSPDGTILATSSWDNTIRLWNTIDSSTLIVLHRHTDMVWDLVFNSDGTLLASASVDSSARLWGVP